MKKRWFIVGIAAAGLLLSAWMVLSMTLLDEDWLKGQLVRTLREAFEIEAQIESLEFHPWQGEADLKGIILDYNKPRHRAHIEADSAHLEMSLLALLFRHVDVRRLEIVRPHLVYEHERPPEPEPVETLDRLAAEVMAHLFDFVLDMLQAILDIFDPQPGYEVTIDELVIRDGQIDYTALRPGKAPFVVHVNTLNYSVRDLKPTSPFAGTWHYVAGADFKADLTVGGVAATVEKRFSAEPRTLAVTGLDLGQVDPYMNQKDALVVEGGILDLTYNDGAERFDVEAQLEGLKLGKNKQSEIDDFLFIPVDRLIEHVDEAGGNLTLRFQSDRKEVKTSEDLAFLVAQIWKGMWVQILAREKSDFLEGLKEKGADRLREILGPREELK